MIKKSGCLLLGTISKSHGTKGAVMLMLRNIKAVEIKKRDSLFIEINGLLVPFFIDLFQVTNPETLILKFEGVDSETKARTFAGNSVYVNHDQITKKRQSVKALPALSGYRVNDVKLGFIGIAEDIADIANNPLLIVSFNNKEYLIPLHEDIIHEVDDAGKLILIEAPEGLLDL